MSPPPVRTGPLIWLAVIVCPLAAGFTGWLGGLAAMMYQLYWGAAGAVNLRSAGMLLGLVGGLLGGMAWCALILGVIVRRLRRTGDASGRIVAWGAFAGHGAAVLAGGILLGGMMVLNGEWNARAVLAGLVVSAIAGLALGALAGLLAWGAAAMARPDAPPPGSRAS